jgi:hypothetical protein
MPAPPELSEEAIVITAGKAEGLLLISIFYQSGIDLTRK